MSEPHNEVCCVCGSAKVVYHNYRNLPFCAKCMDPVYRMSWRMRLQRALKALRGEW